MKHEEVHSLLHKSPEAKTKKDELPICVQCGEDFLGYKNDERCLECENTKSLIKEVRG